MKKKFLSLSSMLVIFTTIALLSLSSCEKEIRTADSKVDGIPLSLPGGAGLCSRPLCFFESLCFDFMGNPICTPVAKACVDFSVCLDFKIPNCQLVDCGNPWNFQKIFVNPIPHLVSQFKVEPSPQPSIGFVPVAVTNKIVWLQFYAPVDKVLTKTGLTLNKSVNLDKNNALKQGLIGHTIPAGKYPVIYDLQTKTYNAIVSVK